jgi:hypothetical protein
MGGVSFYDATGLRFHLPAYLSLAVTDFEREDANNVLDSLMFHLTTLRCTSRAGLVHDKENLRVRSLLNTWQ